MPLVLVTPPAAEPLSLAETKAQLRIEETVTADDARVASLITAARSHTEKVLGKSLITQTWDLVLDAFPCDELELAKGRLQSVTSVKYIDPDGVEQTLDPAKYLVDTAPTPGRIFPAYGQFWPMTRYQASAVRVRFVAGFGAAAANVPEDIRQALLLAIGHWYENRETVVIAPGIVATSLPLAFEALLRPHMSW